MVHWRNFRRTSVTRFQRMRLQSWSGASPHSSRRTFVFLVLSIMGKYKRFLTGLGLGKHSYIFYFEIINLASFQKISSRFGGPRNKLS